MSDQVSQRELYRDLALVSGPLLEPLTLDDAKNHLRVKWEEENAYIESLIPAAREYVDGRDGALGRALQTQTWDYTLRRFPTERCIRLLLPPVQSIVSVKYRDVGGTLQTFGSSSYTISADRHWQPEVQLAVGASWPATGEQQDAVIIQAIHGYGDAAESVPMPIRQALLLLIGHWYANREVVLTGTISKEIELAVEALLAPYTITAF